VVAPPIGRGPSISNESPLHPQGLRSPEACWSPYVATSAYRDNRARQPAGSEPVRGFPKPAKAIRRHRLWRCMDVAGDRRHGIQPRATRTYHDPRKRLADDQRHSLIVLRRLATEEAWTSEIDEAHTIRVIAARADLEIGTEIRYSADSAPANSLIWGLRARVRDPLHAATRSARRSARTDRS
jgi:hypothetical protein